MLLPNRVGPLVQGMVGVGLVQTGMEAEGLKSTLSTTAGSLPRESQGSWLFLCQLQRQTFFGPAQYGLSLLPSGCGSKEAPPPERCSNGGCFRVHGDGGGGGGLPSTSHWPPPPPPPPQPGSRSSEQTSRGSRLPLTTSRGCQSRGTRRRSWRPSNAREGARARQRADMSDQLSPVPDF